MDRAERLFEELAASREYRDSALEHLLRIYEQQMDWPNALKIFHELPASVQAERKRVAAHYLCELVGAGAASGRRRARAGAAEAGAHARRVAARAPAFWPRESSNRWAIRAAR